MKIFQITEFISYGDAIGNNIFAIKKYLDRNGVENDIYTLGSDKKIAEKRKDLSLLSSVKKDDIILCHFCLKPDVAEQIKNLNCKKVFIYHNITPPEFLRDFCQNLSSECSIGLDALKPLSKYFDCGIGDSKFNTSELKNFGFKNLFTVPVMMNLGKFNKYKGSKKNDPVTRILFVGRFVPNKKYEDIIKSFYIYNKYYNKNSILTLVGNNSFSPDYFKCLKKLIKELDIEDNIEIKLCINDEELVETFHSADLFLCMSEHEGFCVPLVEAMTVNIPIVAYSCTAIPETLGEDHQGLLETKNYDKVAAKIDEILENEDLLEEVKQYQKNRLKKFSNEEIGSKLDVVIKFLKNQKPKKSPKETFSIVINTYNRWDYLLDLMKAIEKQEYKLFEVIVVNGPSTDQTYKIKELYPNIKYLEIKKRNLAISRNVGVNAARGDYVLFVDDDAVPTDNFWLLNTLTHFKENDDSIVVGGAVFRGDTNEYEFCGAYSNDYGDQIFMKKDNTEAVPKGDRWFERPMGANMAFKREDLLKVGGFDEFFIYYIEENEVCDRLSRIGIKTKNFLDNPVRHYMANSTVRGNGYDLKWSTITRSIGYSGMKNGKDNFLTRILIILRSLSKKYKLDIISLYKLHHIGFRDMLRYSIKFWLGGAYGILCGIFLPRKTIKKNSEAEFQYINFHRDL